jgi:alpha-tubulin suppressor-like RCC1 family protein/Leucine-rich repeat (LRR) protein
MRKILLFLLVLLNIQINAQCWKTIAAGYDHTVAVKTDGTLWAWGNNNVGQLGDGTTTYRNVPTNIGTTSDWKTVAIGTNHTVALKMDGSLWAWGDNQTGELGDGTNINKNIPVQIGTAKDWQIAAAGNQYTVALKTDGTLWAWGDNYFGELGDGTSSGKKTPTQIGTEKNWQTITVGYYHTIGVKTDGTLWVWGGNESGQLGDGTTTKSYTQKRIGTATDWKTITAGESHTIAIKTDGTLWAWGKNKYGELGSSTTTDSYIPTKIGTSTDWKDINSEGSHTIATKTDGTLWAWGDNFYGELGNGTTIKSLFPIQIGSANNWQAVSAGRNHTVALKTDGTLFTWGYNSSGQLGNATNADKKVPTSIACPEAFAVMTAKTNISCTSDTSGSASITSVSGGTTPYSYLWSNGATVAAITGLAAGNYSCTITDAASLSITKSFTITQPTSVSFTTTSTNACNNNNNGSITGTATGGTTPYQYAISPNFVYQTSNVFANLSAGTYTVYVKDANGCTSSNTVTVTNTQPPTATAQLFNTGATVANLQATGLNIKWYIDVTGGTSLTLSTTLQTGKYYASQTNNGCESSRTAVDITVTVTPISTPAYVPTNGLLAYYPFNGNANDTSGNGYNGVVTGATLTIDRMGNANKAYSFDGLSSYIDAAIATIPQNNTPRTISGWFKTNTPNYNETSNTCIFNYGNLSPAQRFSLCIYSKGYLNFITGSDFSNNDFGAQNNYLDNNWYFFTITYDGTKASLFVNGNYVNGGNTTLNTINKTFRIGKRITGDAYNEYFKGTIDDIGIWNRVLTQQEILGLYNSGQTVSITTTISANSSTTFCVGNSVQLTSVVSPSGPYTYIWIRNGIIIPNQTSANYTANLSGSYSLRVTNANDSSITSDSNVVNITVNETPPPTANTQTFNTGATVANLQASGINIKWYNTNIGGTSLSTSTVLQTNKYYASQTVNGCESTRTAIDVITQASTTYTLIPDFNFENKLITLGIDSGTADGKVLTSSIVSLQSLDVSSSSIVDLTGIQDFLNLKELRCYANQLISLNVSKNTALTYLSCSFNNLTTLDVSMNTGLTTLGCGNNQLTTLDISKNIALTNLGCLNNQLTALDVSKNSALTILDCSNNQLTALDISKNTVLKYFSFNTNQLTIIDLSKNTALFDLSCYSNRLTVLDVSINKGLTYLYCNSNNLTTLDLTKNTVLTMLDCSSNQLISFNLKNGNNVNFQNKHINFQYNPNLACIQVDDVAYSNANWSAKKDATASYSDNCPPPYVVISSTFEDKLIALGIDTDGKNGSVLLANISNVTSIDVSNYGIINLSGIEYFTALETLICKGNSLTTINVSNNTALKYLDCSNNPLTTLDVSKNKLLSELYCDGVVTIIKKNSNTKNSNAAQLTVLDLSNNLFLTKLSCSNNQLVSLDVSKNTLLTDINCSNNSLQNLNVSNGNNTKMLNVNFKSNSSLSCIKVDDTVFSNANWAGAKDATTIYSKTACTLGIEDVVFDKITLYPNPVKGQLHIDNIVLEKVTVYDAIGKLIKTTSFTSGSNDNTINLTGLPKGIYYVYLQSQGITTTRKIIIQ